MARREPPHSAGYTVLTVGTWDELGYAVMAILGDDVEVIAPRMRAMVNRLREAWTRVVRELEGGHS